MPRYPQVIEFRCTWPGCTYSICDLSSIEYHVRQTHLGPKNETDLEGDLSDHEEEFYYTEVEVSRADVMTNTVVTLPVHPHKDMCRPSHEDPDYQKTKGYPIVRSSNNTPTANTPWSSFTKQMKLGNSYTGIQPDISSNRSNNNNNNNNSNNNNRAFTFGSSEMSWQPSSLSASAPNKINVSKTPGSPTRKARGETKKCRKVYGMEHRELWCTQCKWKKACSRFGD
ncbi:zinc finger protein, putative [Pediculus humanus corporis]|uniref:Zinc finger protein, putative n=1 Tax=Pediculus humanus subsp. corporis TaxID=121224 RepID=E0VWP5_PEDHC|nr:zinc finger protein, putative [Pediculus humanus corporis]EEB17801.1 zinc finger protein, putative [Pediculus humanus corporis]